MTEAQCGLKIHHSPALANFSNVPRPGNGDRAATNDAPADGICSSRRLSADRLGSFPWKYDWVQRNAIRLDLTLRCNSVSQMRNCI